MTESNHRTVSGSKGAGQRMTSDDEFDNTKRGPQARSACVICARGKRRCEGGRPCDRCIRIDKAEACLAGLPYESGICRKRRRGTTKKRKDSRDAQALDSSSELLKSARNEAEMESYPTRVNFKLLTAEGIVTSAFQDSPSSARLCAPLKRESSSRGKFESIKRVRSDLAKGMEFHLNQTSLHMLGYFAENELVNCQSRSPKTQDGACQNGRSRPAKQWGPYVSNSLSEKTFQLRRVGELGRDVGHSAQSSTNSISRERLATEALASLIADGFTLQDIENMANACISGIAKNSATPGPATEYTDTIPPITDPNQSGEEASVLEGMLMLNGKWRESSDPCSVAFAQYASSSNTMSTHCHQSSSCCAEEAEYEFDRRRSFSELPPYYSQEENTDEIIISSKGGSKLKHELLNLVRNVPLENYMEIPSVPLDSVCRAWDDFPKEVQKELVDIAYCYYDRSAEQIARSLADPGFTELLLNWYGSFFDETLGTGVAGLSLERFLTSLFNVPHRERIPLYDELLGIICNNFSRPIAHVEYDVSAGGPNRIWINNAYLELLNTDGEEIARSCNMELVGRGNGGVCLVRRKRSSGSMAADIHWIHPEILLPRAMATTQAQLLNCSIFSFTGKYLRKAEGPRTTENRKGPVSYSGFQAKEVLHCVRHTDGPLYSVTQCFINPEIHTEVSICDDLIAPGKQMMRKFLKPNHGCL
eukprot:gb/GECG01006839.1/.p1 GENE.gb/GECG01006839.1/~~gb/GECG01006839.1/.p1  ORF type:complete len:704 (+),score=74.01 gb/GECG01006839.1/:1-2112(+)